MNQFEHTWNVFERLVLDFNSDGWISTGRGATTPVRLSIHILQATKYYLKDQSEINFASGKAFDIDSENVSADELPSQNDIRMCIGEFRTKTEKWLHEIGYDEENKSFKWAGDTKLGVVIFLLRHSLYHLGELSSLLNESKNGKVEDHYVKAL